MTPHPTQRSIDDGETAYVENWVVYRSPAFSATELTVRPLQTVTIRDTDPYGLIIVQGVGKVGVHDVEAATLLRYGQLSRDELFVSEAAAVDGVEVVNRSATSDLVMLKHFGPGNRSLVAL